MESAAAEAGTFHQGPDLCLEDTLLVLAGRTLAEGGTLAVRHTVAVHHTVAVRHTVAAARLRLHHARTQVGRRWRWQDTLVGCFCIRTAPSGTCTGRTAQAFGKRCHVCRGSMGNRTPSLVLLCNIPVGFVAAAYPIAISSVAISAAKCTRNDCTHNPDTANDADDDSNNSAYVVRTKKILE